MNEAVINYVEAPRLKKISVRQFVESKRPREHQETEREEQPRHLKEEIVPASCRASIDDDDLKIFISAGCIESSSIDELTEPQIEQCLERRCKTETTGKKLYHEN